MPTWKSVPLVFALIATTGAIRSDDTQNAPTAALEVINEAGKLFSYRMSDLAKLPQLQVTATDHKGETAKFSGVTVATVLKQSDVALGSGLKGAALAHYLLVEASDKYRVVFSLPEVDPEWIDHTVLLATSRNGEPLDATHGPLQIVASGDKRHSRWVKQVERLTIRKDAK